MNKSLFASRRGLRRAAIEALETRTFLSASTLDPAFGTGGKVITPFNGDTQTVAQAVASLANGKILVAAEAGANIAVLRYLPNGQLDTTFATAGKDIIGFGTGRVGQNVSLAVQAGGKILVSGDDQVAATSANEAFVLRLNANGGLDSTFGTGGETLFHFGGDDGYYKVASLSTGKLIVATSGPSTTTSGSFLARRLNANGTVDSTFGVAGTATIKFSLSLFLDSIAIQTDGKIVVGGIAYGTQRGVAYAELARFNSNGTVDTAFGGGGIATGSEDYNQGNALAIQSDGKIIIAGNETEFSAVFYLQRFNTNGTIDTSFGGSAGVQTLIPTSPQAGIEGVAIQGDGKVVAVGYGQDNAMTIARYTTSGALDSTFGTGGIVTAAFGTNVEAGAEAVSIQSSGRIVVVGGISPTIGQNEVAIARLLGDHVFLAAGQSSVTTGVSIAADSRLTGTIIASQSLAFTAGSGTSAVKGTLTEWVEKETVGGTLDFYYQITDATGPAAGIASLLASNFLGFQTYVDYRTDSAGTIAPINTVRSTDHKSITFTFAAAPNGNGTVTPGKESHSLVIKTDATNFDSAGAVLLNGSISLKGYEPKAAVANTAGKLDPSFGVGGGTGQQPFSPLADVGPIMAMFPLSNGQIVIAGRGVNYDATSLQRFSANGVVADPSFGTSGLVLTGDMQLGAAAIQSNGMFVLAGDSNNKSGAVEVQRYTSAGKLDTTFGTGGSITTTIAGGSVLVSAESILSNGDILVLGNDQVGQTVYPILLRYTSAGKLDATFAKSGIDIITAFGNTRSNAMLVQSNGDILIGGAQELSTGEAVSAIRLLSSGAADATFGVGGLAVNKQFQAHGSSIAIQPGGTIVVGAEGSGGGLLDAFTSAGKIDNAFGTLGVSGTSFAIFALAAEPDGTLIGVSSGQVTHFLANGSQFGGETTFGGTAIAAQSNGNYLIGGGAGTARVTPAGAFDPTFGRNGIVSTNGNNTAGFLGKPTATAIQSNGKILEAGYDGVSFISYIERYNADGSVDTTFGLGGIVTYRGQTQINAMAVDSSGRILVAGFAYLPGNSAGFVARYNANGTLDTTFANAGIYTMTGVGPAFSALALQSNGDIVVGGTLSATNHHNTFLLVRLLTTGKLDISFGTGGVVSTSVLGTNDQMTALAIQKNGSIVAAGFAQKSADTDSIAVVRYTSAGKIDTTFATSGKFVLDIGATGGDVNIVGQVAIDSQGRIVLGATDDFNSQGLVIRLTSAGALDKTFATAGIFTLPNSDVGTGVDSIVILAGDKILAGGFSEFQQPSGPSNTNAAHPKLGGEVFNDFTLMQLTSTGAADTTFASGGLYVDPQTANDIGPAAALAIQSDGKIIAAAGIGESAGLVRLTGP